MRRKSSASSSSSASQSIDKPTYEKFTLTEEGHKVVRYVKPYIYNFETFAKGRWLGRRVLDVMKEEFGGHPPAYWDTAIVEGRVRINDHVINDQVCFANGDRLLHRSHRHEPPVFGDIRFLVAQDDLMAISKPASLPMHACGAYRYNSLENLLRFDPPEGFPITNLDENAKEGERRGDGEGTRVHLVHRLDRLTSGLVVLARTSAAASRLSEEIRSRRTSKIYLARVRGVFPPPPTDLTPLRLFTPDEAMAMIASIRDDDDEGNGNGQSKKNRKKRKRDDEDGEGAGGASGPGIGRVPSRDEVCAASSNVGYWQTTTTATSSSVPLSTLWVACPISVVSRKNGVHACDTGPNSKISLSAFRAVAYCPVTNTTLVACSPITGRTHQLRLHLQLLQTPIANDPNYGGDAFFREESKREKAQEALRNMRARGLLPLCRPSHLEGSAGQLAYLKSNEEEEEAQQGKTNTDMIKTNLMDFKQRTDESDDDYLVRTCRFCQHGTSARDLAEERLLHCDGIWLHAYQYAGQFSQSAEKEKDKSWLFRAEVPEWAESFFTNGEEAEQK
eukprot:scaffold1561_cov184-Ochromonas_danica.AAC.4